MKVERVFDKFIKILSLIIFLWIFILIIFFENKIDYSMKNTFLISNIKLLIITSLGVLLFILLFKFIKNKIKLKKINYDKVVKRMVFILFFVQLYVFYHAYFETGWDPVILVRDARRLVSGGKIVSTNYFSMYPNNMLYMVILTLMLKLNALCGIFTNDYDLMSIVVLNCLISSISSYLVYSVGKKIFNKKIAIIGYLLSVLLFVFSPWNIITYTDSFGIFIPILILNIYISKRIKPYIKYPLILTLGYLGYSIKPQTFIIVIAILIVEFIKFISKLSLEKIKKVIITSLITILSVAVVNTAVSDLYDITHYKVNSEKTFEYTHFLMMGVNNENNGGWSRRDVDFSRSKPTKKIRREENLKVYKKRVKSYGFGGYFKFLSKKLLTVYNDGTYAWMREGNFLRSIKPEISSISNAIRNVYYGKYYKYYKTFLQAIWLNVLLIITINSIIMLVKRNKKIDYTYLVVILTIIGLTLFELLFEVRARYLYTNVPIFILLMMYGLNNVSTIKFKKRGKSV